MAHIYPFTLNCPGRFASNPFNPSSLLRIGCVRLVRIKTRSTVLIRVWSECSMGNWNYFLYYLSFIRPIPFEIPSYSAHRLYVCLFTLNNLRATCRQHAPILLKPGTLELDNFILFCQMKSEGEIPQLQVLQKGVVEYEFLYWECRLTPHESFWAITQILVD